MFAPVALKRVASNNFNVSRRGGFRDADTVGVSSDTHTVTWDGSGLLEGRDVYAVICANRALHATTLPTLEGADGEVLASDDSYFGFRVALVKWTLAADGDATMALVTTLDSATSQFQVQILEATDARFVDAAFVGNATPTSGQSPTVAHGGAVNKVFAVAWGRDDPFETTGWSWGGGMTLLENNDALAATRGGATGEISNVETEAYTVTGTGSVDAECGTFAIMFEMDTRANAAPSLSLSFLSSKADIAVSGSATLTLPLDMSGHDGVSDVVLSVGSFMQANGVIESISLDGHGPVYASEPSGSTSDVDHGVFVFSGRAYAASSDVVLTCDINQWNFTVHAHTASRPITSLETKFNGVAASVTEIDGSFNSSAGAAILAGQMGANHDQNPTIVGLTKTAETDARSNEWLVSAIANNVGAEEPKTITFTSSLDTKILTVVELKG